MNTTTYTGRSGRYLVNLDSARPGGEPGTAGADFINAEVKRWIKSRNDWAKTWNVMTFSREAFAELTK